MDHAPPTRTTPPAPRRPWTLRRLAGFALYGAVAGFLLLEVGMRILSTEEDGHLVFADVKLVPFEIVPESHRRILGMDPADLPYVVPDAQLGWTIRPGGRSRDGLYASNGLGLRSAPKEASPEKAPGVTRVLLVGDSFTHGDEVPWRETWAARLQEELGETFEVLNGGVPGFGTDQALLRSRILREELHPDVIVLGIYHEDIWRNLTVFRAVKHHWTHFPWSKPRFMLEGDGLRLVNQPVVPPDHVQETLEHYDQSPLRAYDTLWNAELYEDRPIYVSRLARFLASRRIHRDIYEKRQTLQRDRNEGILVTARLARLFQEETAAFGARAIVLLLPGAPGVHGYREGGHPPLRWLHAELQREGTPYFDVGPFLHADLKEEEDEKVLYVRGVGHPNGRACRIIARALASRIRG